MVTGSKRGNLNNKKNPGKGNQKVSSQSMIQNGASYEKQKNTAIGKEKNCNGKKYEKNRAFIFQHILIARLQNIIHTLSRTWRRLNQMRQNWNSSHPYWSHSLTRGRHQPKISTRKSIKNSAIGGLIKMLHSNTAPSTKQDATRI